MAWNGSDSVGSESHADRGRVTSTKSPQKKIAAADSSKRPYQRGLLAGIVIVILGGATVWWFVGGRGVARPAADDGEGTRRPTTIAVAKPQIATNAASTIPVKAGKKAEIRKLPNGQIMKYVDGKKAWMFPRDDYHGPVYTSGVHRVKPLEDITFKNQADRKIAALLLVEPGETLDPPYYDKTFTRAFLRSLNEPELPTSEHTDEQKELIRAVAEVKGDLKARYDAGEDIMQVLCDAQENLRQLGAHKEELEAQVHQYAKDGEASAEDVEMYVEAANLMLEKRGLPKMKITGFIKHQFRVKANQAKANQTKDTTK